VQTRLGPLVIFDLGLTTQEKMLNEIQIWLHT